MNLIFILNKSIYNDLHTHIDVQKEHLPVIVYSFQCFL